MPIYQIYLCDQNEQYVNELQRIRPCYGIYNMAVITGNIFDLRADAIVVPTNTFGFMTSNFELSCINLFGISIQNELHKKIKKTNMQELLVGQSICIKTNNYKLKNCIFSPIIRIPNILTDVYPIYLATKSAVLCAIENNFETVAIPGIGIETGRAPYAPAANAMLLGIKDAIYKNDFPESLQSEKERFNKFIFQ